MTYTPRAYPDIVRDLLTTLTGGTVREALTVPAGDAPLTLPQLAHRPVRRVSHLEGVVAAPAANGGTREIPYRFTRADFDLVSTTGNGELDAIRFRTDGRRPPAGSRVIVNYYPVQTDPVPLTDINVGSVIRTLLETTALEIALVYQHLDHVYRSAFLDTADGGSLDKVVALVGTVRLPAGHPVAKLRFSRRSSTPGRITIPAGTAVTDKDGNRYLTTEPLTLEPGEPSREVLASAVSAATPVVEAGALDRPEVVIAGIESVVNEQPARQLDAPEDDDALRRRARAALHAPLRGTVGALRYGLLSVPKVTDVAITEWPDGREGVIRVDVAYADDDAAPRTEVERRVLELRPAGIVVEWAEASRRLLNVRVALTLAGTGATGDELAAISRGVEERLAGHLAHIPPGGQVRRAQLLSLALQDPRVVDADITLRPAGGPDGPELTLGAGEVLDVRQPFEFPPPASEEAAGPAPPTSATVSAVLPVHLVAGVTLADAAAAIQAGADGHFASRRPGSPLTVDGLAAAVRDDSKFALVRAEVLVTVEAAGVFRQLTDGVGSYDPPPNQTLNRGTFDVQPREGGV